MTSTETVEAPITDTSDLDETPVVFDSSILPEGMRDMYEKMYLPAITKIGEEADRLSKEGKGRADKIAKWKTEDEASAELRQRMERTKAAYDRAVAALTAAAEEAIPAKSDTYDSDRDALKLEQANAKQYRRAIATVLTDAQAATLPEVPTIGQASSSGSSSAHSTGDPEKVRAWARSNGKVVKDRGRLSADLVKEYEAAMSSQNGETS